MRYVSIVNVLYKFKPCTIDTYAVYGILCRELNAKLQSKVSSQSNLRRGQKSGAIFNILQLIDCSSE